MERSAVVFAAVAGFCLLTRADPIPGASASPKEPARRKMVRVILAKEDSEHSTTKFSTDSVKIRALWRGVNLQAGDRLQAVWIADDVGATAPKHTPITGGDVTVYKPDDDGIFSIQRPKEGWPPGKYRFELYLNKKPADAINFTIEHGVTVEIGGVPPPATTPTQTSAPPQLEPSPAVQPKQ
jgi:hypothetical protein